jgi:flagellar motility protein MotE (MotC chaperone)
MKRLRLLPVVIIVGAGLLAVKGAGLVMDARAQDAGATPAANVADTTPQPSDPAADDAQTATSGEVDVLGSLSKRSAELDAREQELDTQSNLIAAAEKRVDDKIAELKSLQSQLQTLMGQRDAAQQAQINALVKTYSSMKPKDAARIFNDLDDDVLLSVAQLMKPDVLGAIMAQMQSDNAQKLTVRLANRLKPAITPPQQVAALTPPASGVPVTPPTTPSAAATPANVAPAPASPAETSQPAAPSPAPAQAAASAPAPTK